MAGKIQNPVMVSFKGKVIGLTGSIGSGKDTLAALFAEWGALVLDADKVGHAVMRKGTKGYKSILDVFGERILDSDGEISRKELSAIVFEDPSFRKVLEAIIHPLIEEDDQYRTSEFLARHPQGVVIKNSPLLLETNLHLTCYKTIVVIADEKRRLVRTRKKRPDLSVGEIRRRMRVQMPDEEKVKRADFVIENNGRIVEFHDKAERMFRHFF